MWCHACGNSVRPARRPGLVFMQSRSKLNYLKRSLHHESTTSYLAFSTYNYCTLMKFFFFKHLIRYHLPTVITLPSFHISNGVRLYSPSSEYVELYFVVAFVSQGNCLNTRIIFTLGKKSFPADEQGSRTQTRKDPTLPCKTPISYGNISYLMVTNSCTRLQII